MASTTSPTSAYRAQNGIAETGSYDPQVVTWIKQAAAATGADARALLATSLQEDGARLHATGDNGTSFGPFQFHVGGALGNHPPEWASTYDAVLNRAGEFARNKVMGGVGAAAVQRPRDRALYARGVDSMLARAEAILGHHGSAGAAGGTMASAPSAPLERATTSAAPAGQTVTDDSADAGPLILEAMNALHANAQLAHLPGWNVMPTGSALGDALASNAALARVGVPALPGAAAAPTVVPPRPPARPNPTRNPLARSSPPNASTLAPGGGWGGSHALAQHFARIGQSMGLSIASEKRARKMTASGGVSDHWVGSKTAYAYDMSNGSKPTPQMDRFAATVAAQLGVKNWKGGVLNVDRGGYRYQVLYRTNVGGNHFNHVHVGVRKL